MLVSDFLLLLNVFNVNSRTFIYAFHWYLSKSNKETIDVNRGIWRIVVDPTLVKEMSLCHKLGFLNPNFFKTKCCRPQIFQIMNSGGSNNVSLKYERYASSGCWDLGIIKLGFVAKTQFLCLQIHFHCRHSNMLKSNITVFEFRQKIITNWVTFKNSSIFNFTEHVPQI